MKRLVGRCSGRCLWGREVTSGKVSTSSDDVSKPALSERLIASKSYHTPSLLHLLPPPLPSLTSPHLSHPVHHSLPPSTPPPQILDSESAQPPSFPEKRDLGVCVSLTGASARYPSACYRHLRSVIRERVGDWAGWGWVGGVLRVLRVVVKWEVKELEGLGCMQNDLCIGR